MVSGSRAVTQNVRTMSVEYRPRFVCCRADREKGVRECTQRPHPRLSPCEASTPPAARGTAYNTPAGRPRHSEQHPPFFPGQMSRWRRRKFHRRKFRRKKVSDFTEFLFLLVRHYLWNILRTVLEISSGVMHPPRDSFKSAAGHTLPLDPREKRKR